MKNRFIKHCEQEFANINENYDKIDEHILQEFYDKNQKLLNKGVIKNEKNYINLYFRFLTVILHKNLQNE